VKGWHRYAIARLTLLGGPEGARPLLRAEEGELATGKALTATFLRGSVDVGDEAALAGWRQLLVGPRMRGQPDSSLEVIVYDVGLEGGLPRWSSLGAGYRTVGLPLLQGELAITPDHRRVYLHGRLATQRARLVVESGEKGATLSLSPPLVLGVERLAESLGWPPALIPRDLEGQVVLSEGPWGRAVDLDAVGSLDLQDLARTLGLPDCSGKMTLTVELALRPDMDASRLHSDQGVGTDRGLGRSRGKVSVALAGSGPATVDPLALEVFRYIFFGQLSDRPLEEDLYAVNRIAFTVTLAGDQVTVTGDDGPLLSGRSQRGYTIELSGPAQATTEELARRVRLALGGLPAAQSAPAREGSEAPSVPASP
jgi:hypothetical protein